MKLWQLTSIMREKGEFEAIKTVALSKPEWQEFAVWLQDLHALVVTQDRVKLDYILPEDLVLDALTRTDRSCFLSNDGRIMRSYRSSPDDESIPLAEAYRRYGGHALEEAFEFGSIAVPTA
jgi:hypothetical protein